MQSVTWINLVLGHKTQGDYIRIHSASLSEIWTCMFLFFFLAACLQNLNKTSEEAGLHHNEQTKGMISFATGLFQSTRFVDKSAHLSNKVHS